MEGHKRGGYQAYFVATSKTKEVAELPTPPMPTLGTYDTTRNKEQLRVCGPQNIACKRLIKLSWPRCIVRAPRLPLIVVACGLLHMNA